MLGVKKIQDSFLSKHEREFSCKECELEIKEREFNGIKITGKIDRIDENAVGEKFLIDYKSGGKKDKSFQLAFYKALLGDESCQSRFIFFGDSEVRDAHKDYSVENLANLINELKKEFADEVNFERITHYGKKPVCKYCPYQIMCKGRADVAEK